FAARGRKNRSRPADEHPSARNPGVMPTPKPCIALALALLSGCYEGTRANDRGDGEASGDPSGPGGDTGSGDTGDSDGDTEDPPDDPEAACDDAEIALGHTPLRRLTRFEYDNVVRDLL